MQGEPRFSLFSKQKDQSFALQTLVIHAIVSLKLRKVNID
jgi:hypothetical protein